MTADSTLCKHVQEACWKSGHKGKKNLFERKGAKYRVALLLRTAIRLCKSEGWSSVLSEQKHLAKLHEIFRAWEGRVSAMKTSSNCVIPVCFTEQEIPALADNPVIKCSWWNCHSSPDLCRGNSPTTPSSCGHEMWRHEFHRCLKWEGPFTVPCGRPIGQQDPEQIVEEPGPSPGPTRPERVWPGAEPGHWN